jgi:anti-repressor protein
MVGGVWVLYAKYQAKGYSRIVTREYVDGDGKLRTSNEMRWTERGAAFIHWLCDKEGFGVNQGQQIASGMFGSP